MKFDSNQAWRDTTHFVRGNREVLLAIAGVFFMMPTLAVGVFLPQPQPPAGADVPALQAMMAEYYASAWPFMLAVALMSAIGTLAVVTLYTDRSRPTVGEAIRRAASGLVPYIAAQFLIGLGAALVGGLLLGLAMASGVRALVTVAAIALIAGLIYVWIRTSLVAPVIGVEDVHHPFAVLRRTWRLTQGNVLRIGAFFVLVLVAMVVVIALVSLVIGLVVALVASGEASRVANAIVSSALTAGATVVTVSMLAAIHHQLAGSGTAVAERFD